MRRDRPRSLKVRSAGPITAGMSHRLLLPAGAVVAALLAAGCGGSDAPAPTPAPAPAATVKPAASKSPGVASADQHAADRRALRAWGKAASRACRRLDRDEHSAFRRAQAAVPGNGERWSSADAERVGKLLRRLDRNHEREYAALRRIPVPKGDEAAYRVFEFLDLEEEGVMITSRLSADLRSHDDPVSFLSGLDRLERFEDEYKRAARRVHAAECAK